MRDWETWRLVVLSLAVVSMTFCGMWAIWIDGNSVTALAACLGIWCFAIGVKP